MLWFGSSPNDGVHGDLAPFPFNHQFTQFRLPSSLLVCDALCVRLKLFARKAYFSLGRRSAPIEGDLAAKF
jgi:hypothetical protein